MIRTLNILLMTIMVLTGQTVALADTSADQKAVNKALAQIRVLAENAIAGIKRFKNNS